MDGIVAQLVDVGVGLVGDALAVAVHVEPREGRDEDRVLAEVVDAVEAFVAAGERGFGEVDRVVDGDHPHRVLRDGERRAEHLHVAERHDHAVFGRDSDRGALASAVRVAPVRHERHAQDAVLLNRARHLGGADRCAGLHVYAAVRLDQFPETHLVWPARAGRRHEFEKTERHLSKVNERPSRDADFHLRGRDAPLDGLFVYHGCISPVNPISTIFPATRNRASAP